MGIARRHHYVWRHYLSAWEKGGKVSVIRGGSCFQTGSVNIAVERDFNRLPILSAADELFIQQFISGTMEDGLLRELAMGWLDKCAIPSRLRRLLAEQSPHDPEVGKLIEQIEIQSGEDIQTQTENSAIGLLDQLRNGKTNIWRNDGDAQDFAFFLGLQHLRTKKIRDRMVAGFPEGPLRELMARAWPVFRLVFATNIGWSLFSERRDWRLRILQPAEGFRFITSDQPTQNLTPGSGHNDLAFYYPVSPQVAMLLERQNVESVVGLCDSLSDEAVGVLNRRIFDGSHEQVFGDDVQYLQTFERLR